MSQILKQYPPDALLTTPDVDVIGPNEAHTLDELFRARVRKSPDQVAYRQFDSDSGQWINQTWAQIAVQVERWQVAFREQGLVKGDRVAICHRNSVDWVVFDQAALRLGLVVVPLYTADRADNMAYVLANSRAHLVLLEESEIWSDIADSGEDLSGLSVVLSHHTGDHNERITLVEDWLPQHGQHLERGCAEASDLASIVYTSGTTGRPKGVMLSHRNMLSNAYAGLRSVAVQSQSRLLSFLPLSHTLERTVGYYASMMAGAVVSFNRSIPQLADDLKLVQPEVLVSVPRIFERIHNQIFEQVSEASSIKQTLFCLAIEVGWRRFEHKQGRQSWHPKLLLAPILDHLVAKPIRARLGGCLETVIVGGAPLSPQVARTFIALGIPLLQGYGLTESSPIISVNTLNANKPKTIGQLIRGVEVKIMDRDELWVKGDNVMMGYWGMPEATAKVFDDGWLKTGDRAAIDDEGFLSIIGRIKDILVLANGEKVPPADIEAAILRDNAFEQVMVLGEGKSFLSALVVLSNSGDKIHEQAGEDALLSRIQTQMDDFPGYARIRKIHVCKEEWSIENGMLTPTLKMKRPVIMEHYQAAIAELYKGHGVHQS